MLKHLEFANYCFGEDRHMATKSAWLAFVEERASSSKRTIIASQVSITTIVEKTTLECSRGVRSHQKAAFQHEKFTLQLHLETNPVPFRPSTVLAQLISGEQRRGLSTKQQKLRVKNAEHLERKLESEVRQHYENECAQACTKWKQLHLHLMENQRQITDRIEHQAKQMGELLTVEIPSFSMDTLTNQDDEILDEEAEIQRQQLLVEGEWIQQERFNIQEAFTNQTKKIQADYRAFIDQLDAEFIAERRKILAQTMPEVSQSGLNKSPDKRHKTEATQLNRQFKSNVKRHMLVQTAPVVNLQISKDGSKSMLSKARSHSSKSITSDMTPTNRQLQDLEQRLAMLKETAEARLKDGMQWIARQCAHMFTQLDCKEAEAKLVLLLTQQNNHGAQKLLHHVDSVASLLKTAINKQNGQFPGLPSLQTPPSVAHTSSCLTPLTAPAKAPLRGPRRRSEPVGLK